MQDFFFATDGLATNSTEDTNGVATDCVDLHGWVCHRLDGFTRIKVESICENLCQSVARSQPRIARKPRMVLPQIKWIYTDGFATDYMDLHG